MLLLVKVDRMNVKMRAQRPGFAQMKRDSSTNVLIDTFKSIFKDFAGAGEMPSSSVSDSGARWLKAASFFFASWSVSGRNRASTAPRAINPDATNSAVNGSVFISHQDNGIPTTVDMSAAAETWKKMGPLCIY